MPARVLLGNRGGVFRFAVSKPGFDVTTALDGQMMFDSSKSHIRLIQSGFIVLGINSVVNIAVPTGAAYQGFVYHTYPGDITDNWQPTRVDQNNPSAQGIRYSYDGATLTFQRVDLRGGAPAFVTVRYSIWGW